MYSITPTTFTINNIGIANENELSTGFYIVITNALAIPPHLGLMFNGQLYSLSIKGTTVNGKLITFMRTLKAKNLPTLFIRLKLPADIEELVLKYRLVAHILCYTQVDASKNITCLSPIKDACQSIFQIPSKDVNVIFDLLPKLHEQNSITHYYAFNLNEKISNNKITLRKYDLAAVTNSITTVLTDQLL